ncbi:hypothetical protein [Ideonella sp.]|uniref:hypothetical protein n=1 Tax=Ideonella sp. TaxID=1929293 RepID=UPI0035B181C7
MPPPPSLIPPLAASLLAVSLGAVAAAGPAGRWEGEARIPGAPQRMVLDLATGPSGEWAGSLTLPGRGVKGAPLGSLQVGADGSVQADAAGAFGGPPSELPTQLVLRPQPGGQLEGEWRQGGHSAVLALRRSGDAQVDPPPARTTLPAALAGNWRGRYELGGYPREVTLTLQATTHPSAHAGELLIVGKRHSQLVIDRVNAGERFVTLEASAAGIRLEGRWDAAAGAFDGSFFQGPFEAPLKLQRDAADARSGSGS